MVHPVGEDRLPLIAARGVGKTFQLPEHQVHTLKERVLHPRRRIHKRQYPALHDVSFAVNRGEFFGIAGRNGSGKSTLLKCIAGIYRCEGDIWCRGRLSTFIELGVGFDPDLAARDNVVMNGIMMGLSPKEARKRYESVIEFAELEEFKDLKLKNYSSGMHVRLAFSVAIQVDADILLIDEILAVGDAAFQQKCFDVFNRMHDEGKTIVFVTHDMGSLSHFCDRAMLLERGKVVDIGDSEKIGERYLELNFNRNPNAGTDGAPERHGDGDGDGEARVIDVWLEDERGARLSAAAQHNRVVLKAAVLFEIDVEDPQAGIIIYNDSHAAVLVAGTAVDLEHTGHFRAGERAVFSFAFDNVLAPGRYSPVVHLAHRGTGLNVIDRFQGSFSFVVSGARALGGIVDLPVEVSVARADEPVSSEQLSSEQLA
jgi:ABC-type polysaccharide/polyol phosphate transport system ATPase subunit